MIYRAILKVSYQVIAFDFENATSAIRFLEMATNTFNPAIAMDELKEAKLVLVKEDK